MRMTVRAALLFLALLALLSGTQQFSVAHASEGVDWNQVTLIYTGDVGGKIEPCG